MPASISTSVSGQMTSNKSQWPAMPPTPTSTPIIAQNQIRREEVEKCPTYDSLLQAIQSLVNLFPNGRAWQYRGWLSQMLHSLESDKRLPSPEEARGWMEWLDQKDSKNQDYIQKVNPLNHIEVERLRNKVKSTLQPITQSQPPAIQSPTIQSRTAHTIQPPLTQLHTTPRLDHPPKRSAEPMDGFNAKRRPLGISISFTDEDDEDTPSDMRELKSAVSATRASPTLTAEHAKQFRRRINNNCANVEAVMQSVFPMIINLNWLLENRFLYTVPNQQWKISSNIPSVIIKPSQTIGLSTANLGYDDVLNSLGTLARPVVSVAGIAFPFFTVEMSEKPGSQDALRAQNLKNAYFMCDYIHDLHRTAPIDKEGFEGVVVGTLSICPYFVELSYYWLSQDLKGKIQYKARTYSSWNPRKNSDDEYFEIQNCPENLLKYLSLKMHTYISARLQKMDESIKHNHIID